MPSFINLITAEITLENVIQGKPKIKTMVKDNKD